ncbi:hypothetical protein ACQJBY_073573 [Aegilops geniculata]
MAAACRFAAPLGLAPLPRGRAVAKSIAFSVGSAKAVPRGVAMKAANGTSGGEETPEIVGSLCCIGIIKRAEEVFLSTQVKETSGPPSDKDLRRNMNLLQQLGILSCGGTAWLSFAQSAQSSEGVKLNMVYEVGELFELGIQLSYLLILLGLLGTGTFFVIRQVLVRRELDLSAKDLQEQVRSGEGSATELFELGAVMLRRKFYPAAIKYLQQAIQKWDRDEQDLAQVYNALGVSYKRENKLDKAIKQFEKAVELQPGYVTAWNNLGDAYEQQKDLASALRAFEEVLLFDPNNKVARPRRDDLKSRVGMYKGVPVKTTDKR